MTVRPTKTQISLGIRPVWSESSLSAWRKLGSLATHWAHNEDSDQTGRMPWLIWVFAGHTLILLVLSCRDSILIRILFICYLARLSVFKWTVCFLYFWSFSVWQSGPTICDWDTSWILYLVYNLMFTKLFLVVVPTLQLDLVSTEFEGQSHKGSLPLVGFSYASSF